MKNIFFLLFLLAALNLHSQTAVNFNCNDCNGVNHDLFEQLDAGKIVVLVWVMPCSPCIMPAKTAYNVVQTYATSHPEKVVYYLCDDYANTNCTSLQSWANTNSIVPSAIFSNSAINMLDYGTTGMPKMLVLGGAAHKVYDNQNNSFNHNQIVAAIDLAISESTSLIINETSQNFMSAYYNNSQINLTYDSNSTKNITVSIFDYLGRKIAKETQFNTNTGENNLTIKTETLASGLYLVIVSDGNSKKALKIIVD